MRQAPSKRSMRIGAGVERADEVLGKTAASNCFHYCAPTHGGWGVIRTAMLVPEMYMLFVSPAACGRHGAIAAIEQGCKERVGYLCIEEDEIVMGSYEDEIRWALPALFPRISPRPKAFMIVVSCIDDLLGTDYDLMLADFEAAFGIPFRLGRMNPTSLDSKLPPGIRIQRDMYDFLSPGRGAEDIIGHLGAFQPISAESELSRFLRERAGLPLVHVAQCGSFDDFQRLASARLNLVTRPEGFEAASNLKKKLGTPFLFIPTAFSHAAIERGHGAVAGYLGREFDHGDALRLRKQSETETREAAGQYSIAIDDTATCSPFDLARALIEAGFHVKEIFTHKFPQYERPAFAWLSTHSPDTLVTSPVHHSTSWLRPKAPTADIAIGFTAGYLTQAPFVVPITFDEGLSGHHGVCSVLGRIARAVTAPAGESLEKMVRAYGLVV